MLLTRALPFTLSLTAVIFIAVQPSHGQPSATNPQLPAMRRQMHPRNVEQMPTSRREAALGDDYRLRVEPEVNRRRVIRPGFSDWQLGVNTKDAPLGVRVVNVATWSPAYFAGLEEDDYVLDVNGYPVGTYSGGYFPLQAAFSALADPNGWVELGVWNHRNRREEYMWVQLQRR